MGAAGTLPAGVEARQEGDITDEGGGKFGFVAGFVSEDASFDPAEAAELPVGGGEAIDQTVFRKGARPEGVAESLDKGGLGLGIFAVDDIEFGVDTGFEGIAAGNGFAFRGARAGGFQGIAAVRLELFFGCHFWASPRR